VQIGAGQTVVVGDNGDLVFNQIKTGNGTFDVTPAGTNTGTGILGATAVTDPASYTAGSYSINFTAPDAYQVVSSGGTVVTAGTYTSGQAITFAGMQVTLSGTPAAGDSFAVAPSTDQSIFTTVQNLANALQQATATPGGQAQLNNSIVAAINGIDQALDNTQTVQSSLGARLNTITTAQAVATTQQTQLQQSITNIQGLDYASAVTNLDSQNTTLQAAMEAFTQTEGLSLFKYLQG
jgi:flagellar hook-associated protein 3 FlgL